MGAVLYLLLIYLRIYDKLIDDDLIKARCTLLLSDLQSNSIVWQLIGQADSGYCSTSFGSFLGGFPTEMEKKHRRCISGQGSQRPGTKISTMRLPYAAGFMKRASDAVLDVWPCVSTRTNVLIPTEYTQPLYPDHRDCHVARLSATSAWVYAVNLRRLGNLRRLLLSCPGSLPR
ncbi:MAG: hypothetical protein CSYNP_04361 [Syntrophus sp. SKADARSKE-3]|nr:hypothetical protein [Syntrophus sp. SKADARSKE-3]